MMKVLLLNGSANNMAWLLKKIHANGNPDYPEREEWLGMNFIR